MCAVCVRVCCVPEGNGKCKVGVRITSENLHTGVAKHVCSAYFTFVINSTSKGMFRVCFACVFVSALMCARLLTVYVWREWRVCTCGCVLTLDLEKPAVIPLVPETEGDKLRNQMAQERRRIRLMRKNVRRTHTHTPRPTRHAHSYAYVPTNHRDSRCILTN